MRIGELAEASGASIRSLRHYEANGLIAASRTPSGQRLFDAAAVGRVKLVRQLLKAGLGVRAIADVLPCLTEPASQTVALTERLVRERDRLDDEIAARLRMRETLDAVISTAPIP